MLTLLPYDIQREILDYLGDAKKIIALYGSSGDLIKEMIEHTNIIRIDCNEILSDEEIEWFQIKNIKVNLLKEYKIDRHGEYWYENGKLDNGDLPAIIYRNLGKIWYKKGQRHRDNNLPAVECFSGHQEWYENGDQVWYKNGVKYTEYCDFVRANEQQAVSNQRQVWCENGVNHRYYRHNESPAIISRNGSQVWY
jgi:hypothetical protein